MNISSTLLPIATAIIVLVVVLAGAIVVITDPATLSFKEYVQTVGVAVGLLAIGRGLDSTSKP